MASLDPLGISSADLNSEIPGELLPQNYGLGMYYCCRFLLVFLLLTDACCYSDVLAVLVLQLAQGRSKECKDTYSYDCICCRFYHISDSSFSGCYVFDLVFLWVGLLILMKTVWICCN